MDKQIGQRLREMRLKAKLSQVRTPLKEITPTGEIEQRFR